MKKVLKRALMLALCCALLAVGMPSAVSAAGTGFPDVPSDAWYLNALEHVMLFNGLINGDDRDGDGINEFRPDDSLKRAEFLVLLIKGAQACGGSLYTTDRSRDSIHWGGKYYTIAFENNLLVADAYESSDSGVKQIFECTFDEMEKPITRYEMAVLLNNTLTNVLMEKTVVVENMAEYVPDYDSVSSQYVNAVEQAYGKGILTGYGNTPGIPDGSFVGDDTLTRGQAAMVLYKMMWDGERKMADFASEQELPVNTGAAPEGFVSFAQWLQSGHIDSYGNLDTEARIALFGDANKTYFRNSAEAEPFMETITVPVWIMDKAGNKSPSTASLTVHHLVADEVSYIFREIYDDPEQFPIYGGWSVGGSRYTDTMRHSWGCAIDINAYYNCECRVWSDNSINVTCGYGWWPAYTDRTVFAGSMSGPSEYSIASGGSVVRAFAKYGWGWGGNGYRVQSNGSQKFDYMHFSVLPSGG